MQIKTAKKERVAALTLHEADEADLSAAMDGIAGAIDVFRYSKERSLL